MNEVYEVCKRLKTAGFPQDEQCEQFFCADELMGGAYDRREWTSHAECPNAGECLEYAAEKWGDNCLVTLNLWRGDWQCEIGDFGAQAKDINQAARLALCAALEAQQ